MESKDIQVKSSIILGLHPYRWDFRRVEERLKQLKEYEERAKTVTLTPMEQSLYRSIEKWLAESYAALGKRLVEELKQL
jgi:hypothetical protein